MGHVGTNQTTSFSGKCPQCQGYNSRVRTEVINYDQGETVDKGEQPPILSRTRIFLCNGCQHVWSETIPG